LTEVLPNPEIGVPARLEAAAARFRVWHACCNEGARMTTPIAAPTAAPTPTTPPDLHACEAGKEKGKTFAQFLDERDDEIQPSESDPRRARAGELKGHPENDKRARPGCGADDDGEGRGKRVPPAMTPTLPPPTALDPSFVPGAVLAPAPPIAPATAPAIAEAPETIEPAQPQPVATTPEAGAPLLAPPIAPAPAAIVLSAPTPAPPRTPAVVAAPVEPHATPAPDFDAPAQAPVAEPAEPAPQSAREPAAQSAAAAAAPAAALVAATEPELATSQPAIATAPAAPQSNRPRRPAVVSGTAIAEPAVLPQRAATTGPKEAAPEAPRPALATTTTAAAAAASSAETPPDTATATASPAFSRTAFEAAAPIAPANDAAPAIDRPVDAPAPAAVDPTRGVAVHAGIAHREASVGAAREARGDEAIAKLLSPQAFERALEQLRGEIRTGRDEFRLILEPADLGRLDVNIAARGDGVVLRLTAERSDVAHWLRTDLPILQKAIEKDGLQVLGVEVRSWFDQDASARHRNHDRHEPAELPSSGAFSGHGSKRPGIASSGRTPAAATTRLDLFV
jgi:hypothetical protein